VAADINEIQLHLVELKKACFKNLEYEETLQLLGFKDSTHRKVLFNKLKKTLNPATITHWENNFSQIESGIIHQGKFEKYFAYFCKRVLPFIHSKKTINELFQVKTAVKQKEFYNKNWNTWRWRLLFKVFFSKTIMGKLGRDPEFLKQVEINVSDFIFKMAEEQLSGTLLFNNFILKYNLTAGFGELLPHYLQQENYESISKNIDKFIVYKGFAEEALNTYGSFDAMNLSNIFEYLDLATFKEVGQKINDGLNNNACAAYWNLMVPRKLSELPESHLTFNSQLSDELKRVDKGFFYSKFIVETKNE
jgi:S-adenosylmethionine-diacylglycerol 3-amino-3-carboxypropyl transferase